MPGTGDRAVLLFLCLPSEATTETAPQSPALLALTLTETQTKAKANLIPRELNIQMVYSRAPVI